MADALPTADDILGPPPTPTAAGPGPNPFMGDAAAAPPPAAPLPTSDQILGPAPKASPLDGFFLSRAESAAGRVLTAIGQGAKDNWGASNVGLSDDTTKFLQKTGFLNDWQAGDYSVIKAANEALIRPAAATIDATLRGLGAIFGGAQAGVAQVGEEAGAPILGRDVAGMMESFGATTPGHFTGVAQADAAVSHFALNRALDEARSLNVVGPGGEAAWKGTAEPTTVPPEEQAAAQVVDQAQPAKAMAPEPAPEDAPIPAIAGGPPPEAAPAPPDIHAVARSIDPATFEQYDNLVQRQTTYRRWMDELKQDQIEQATAEAPHTDEITSINRQIADLQTRSQDATPRLQKKYAARLDDLTGQRDDLQTKNQAHIEDATSGDSDAMIRVRGDLQKNDFAMRDLAPKVSDAYAQASDRIGPAATSDSGVAEGQSGEPLPMQVAAPVEDGTVPAEEQSVPAGVEPVSDQSSPAGNEPPLSLNAAADERAAQGASVSAEEVQHAVSPESETRAPVEPINIADDVAKNLTTVGRPTQESKAAAALIQSYYETRAARLGTDAQSLYREEGPGIRAAAPSRARGAKEFAQPAYHGSPHVFDKFTTDKMGSGEGAQAYGWGLYFAGAKRVAQYYREVLSKKAGDVEGRLYHVDIPEDHEYLDWGKSLGEQSPDVQKKVKSILDRINEDTASDYLDRMNVGDFDELTGQDIYRILKRSHTDDVLPARPEEFERGMDAPEFASRTLNDAGVPGLKYLDRGSRSAGDGSHNYVVFDGAKATIREYEQVARGKIAFSNGKTIISLFKNADASTFLHETGHMWLEDLMKDAVDDRAPQSVRDDAASVRAWLGVGEGERIPTKAHEKFARGFERYLMEGRAPTQVLADVFGQFRDWLTKIYQSVTKLRSPITDDIRDVFDRMITQNPDRRAVIAEDREIPSREPKERKPDNIAELLSKKGGIKDDMGDLRAMGADKWHREKGGRRRLLRDDGMPLDKAREVAEEAGYLKYGSSIDDLHDAIRETMAGNERFADEDREQADRWREQRRAMWDKARDEAHAEGLDVPPEDAWHQPDHDIGSSKLFADIAEADASLADPIDAAAEGDRFEEEMDEWMRLEAPELYGEINARRGSGEAGGKSAASGGAGHDEPAAGNGNGPGGGTGQLETVAGGGGGLEAEGSGARTGSGRSVAKSESPQRSGDFFDEPESDLIDKAGNIRLDNLNAPEDVNEVIRQSALENGDFMGARRGVISDAQVLDLADALGMSPKDLDARKLGQAFNAEEIVAARRLLIQSATRVRDHALAAAEGDDAAVMAYAEERSRHMMIQEQVSGITAEAGRAMRAFRRLEGQDQAMALADFLQDATGRTLYQIRAEAQAIKGMGDLASPHKVSKLINDSKKPTFGNMLLEYFINNLISGPATHMTYAIGNTVLSAYQATVETGLAAAIGEVRNRLGREGERVYFGEVSAKLGGAVKSLPTAIKSGGQALKTGMTTLLPGEDGAMSLPFQFDATGEAAMMRDQATTWREVGADTFGTLRGVQDGMISSFQLMMSGGKDGAPLWARIQSPLGAIPDFQIKGMNALPVGSVMRVPGRVVAAIHSFFRATNYSMEKAALAYRSASDEGLQGDVFDSRIADLITSPPAEMMKKARGEATNLSLMGEGSEFINRLSRLTNTDFNLPVVGNVKLAKFIDPFVHISGSILGQSLGERSVLGWLGPEIRASLVGDNGRAAQDMAIAKMLAGTMLGATVATLAARGLFNGSGPTDPHKNLVWRMAGNQAHSVRVGDTWYDVHRLGPVGMLMSTWGDMYEVAHAIGSEDASNVVKLGLKSVSETLLDEGFMSGPAQIMKAVDDPDRYGASWAKGFVSSFTPFSVGSAQMERATDPYQRQANTITEAIRSKLPGLGEDLLPRIDIWGQPMVSRDVAGLPGFSAIYAQKVNNDPVNQAMWRLGMSASMPEKKIRGVQLDEQQYYDFARTAGRLAKERLDILVRQPGFAAQPNAVQSEIIDKVRTSSREQAASMMMMHYPTIIAQAVAAKKAKAGIQ